MLRNLAKSFFICRSLQHNRGINRQIRGLVSKFHLFENKHDAHPFDRDKLETSLTDLRQISQDTLPNSLDPVSLGDSHEIVTILRTFLSNPEIFAKLKNSQIHLIFLCLDSLNFDEAHFSINEINSIIAFCVDQKVITLKIIFNVFDVIFSKSSEIDFEQLIQLNNNFKLLKTVPIKVGFNLAY